MKKEPNCDKGRFGIQYIEYYILNALIYVDCTVYRFLNGKFCCRVDKCSETCV